MVLFWTLPLFFPEKPLKLTIAKPEESRPKSNADSDLFIHTTRSGNFAPNTSHYSTETLSRVVHYFPFNPNTISPEQWKKLGLSDRTILTIQHYLEKGGRFKKPEDLRKIWGLKQAEANGLIPYVLIPSTVTKNSTNGNPWQSNEANTQQLDSLSKQSTIGFGSSKSNSFSNPTTSQSTQSNYQESTPTPYLRKTWKLQPIDINLAGKEQWMAFPGIGEVLAERIVKFRDKMGGFRSVEQVGKTYGIKDSLFQLMRPFLILESATQKKD